MPCNSFNSECLYFYNSSYVKHVSYINKCHFLSSDRTVGIFHSKTIKQKKKSCKSTYLLPLKPSTNQKIPNHPNHPKNQDILKNNTLTFIQRWNYNSAKLLLNFNSSVHPKKIFKVTTSNTNKNTYEFKTFLWQHPTIIGNHSYDFQQK